MKQFRSYNHRPPTPPELIRLPSETKVGKSLSLKELIARDLKGLIEPEKGIEPFFDENYHVPDFKRMDIVDIDVWKVELDAKLVEVSKDIVYEKAQRTKQLEKDARRKAKAESNSADADGVVPSGGS